MARNPEDFRLVLFVGQVSMTLGDSIQLDGKRAEITRIIGAWSGGKNGSVKLVGMSRGIIVNAVRGERSYRHVLVDGNGVGRGMYGWTKR